MRNTDSITTTHTGSLPRPDDLAQMIWDHDEGRESSEERLRERIREAVAETVDKQREVGLGVINDGEVSKSGFSTYIYERYSGFGPPVDDLANAQDLEDFPEMTQRFAEIYPLEHVTMRHCIEPIKLVNPDLVKTDIANLKSALGDFPVERAFMNAPTPGQIAFNNPNDFYGSHEEYLHAAADALRYEYKTIVDSGLNLQLDSPDLAMVGHYRMGPKIEDHMGHIDSAIGAINHALEGLPPERIRLHLCWGNYISPHNHDVPLGDIIERVFKANVETISFEGANPTHEYEWEVFTDKVTLPEDKVIMPGVIDVQNPRLEHPRLVAQRIGRFADAVGRERVIASTDCGFGTFVAWNNVPSSIAWAKLKVLVEGARLASEKLW
jgi:5-methyltetrahydropteroyltriglutamate--homocysteine methyltransferase